MNKKSFIIVILLLLSLFGMSLFVQDTLAKYRKKVSQEVSLNLARWNIKLNNEDIVGKDVITSKITPVFSKNEYVADNVLAPGITGYFDIEIDASEVDVSFTYQLTSVIDDSKTYPDIVVYGYTLDPDNSEEITPYTEEGISGTIEHNATEPVKVRMHIKWDDSAENQMDNLQDTALAIEKSEVIMRGTFTFKQINIQ